MCRIIGDMLLMMTDARVMSTDELKTFLASKTRAYAHWRISKPRVARSDEYWSDFTASCDDVRRSAEDEPMRLKVDRQADAIYLALGKAPASRSYECRF